MAADTVFSATDGVGADDPAEILRGTSLALRSLMRGRDPVFLLTIASFLGPGVVLTPAPSLIGAVLVLVLLMRLGVASRGRALLLAIVFLVGGGRTALQRYEAEATYSRAVAVATPIGGCALEGVVATSPQVMGKPGQSDRTERFLLEITGGRCREDLPSGTLVDVRVAASDLRRGDALAVTGKFAPVHRFDNPAALPSWVRIARTGAAIGGFGDRVEIVSRGGGGGTAIDAARLHVRGRIEQTYHPDATGLARALVLGETDLDEDVASAFRRTGLAHILAVSGTHLVVTVMGIERAIRAVLRRVRFVTERVEAQRVTAIIVLPLIWLYASFAGASGSVNRAALMMTFQVGATLLARKPDGTRSFSLALLAGVLLDPTLILDVSFTLSAAATFGLVALSRPLGQWLGANPPEGAGFGRRAWSVVAEPMAATLAATILCAPMTATLSGELSAIGIVANLIAAPIGELFALPFAIAHVALFWCEPLEQGAALVASGALRAVSAIAMLAASVGGTFPVPPPTTSHIVLLVIVASVFGARRLRLLYVGFCLVALVAVEAGVRHREEGRGELRVTMLDVAQGDSLLVEFPTGEVMLIDGGGLPGSPLDLGQRVIAPTLRGKRRESIDVVVLTHPHPDHYGGLRTAMASVDRVGEFWDSGASENRTAMSLRDDATAKGAILHDPSTLCGERRFGDVIIEVLHPCGGRDGMSPNDASLVMRIRYGARAILLTGDAEEEAEHVLLASGLDLSADVLKVGHHGSRTSTSVELLDAVKPRYAMVSCGVRNKFGHPHEETLDALERFAVALRRTDLEGAITWRTDGEGMWLESARPSN